MQGPVQTGASIPGREQPFRMSSSLYNKPWETGRLNDTSFILAKPLGFLNNSGGRRGPSSTVDFLLLNICEGGVMH